MAIKVKAKLSDDVVNIKLLMKHPMETGRRIDTATGKKIPAHHINELTCTWKDEVLFRSNLGPAVSKNPYLSFKVKGPKSGDQLLFSSVDNKGETDQGKVTIP